MVLTNSFKLFFDKLLSAYLKPFKPLESNSDFFVKKAFLIVSTSISMFSGSMTQPDLASLITLAESLSISTDAIIGFWKTYKQVILKVLSLKLHLF